MKKTKVKSAINTIKKRSSKYSKTKGNTYEQKIARELRDIGFLSVLTSRYESTRFDDNKIDIVDTSGKLPCHIQLKCTQNIPAYFKIKDDCQFNDKPFVIIWNKQEKKEVNICSVGEIAMIPKSFFYDLLKLYITNNN